MKNLQLQLVPETCKEYNNNNTNNKGGGRGLASIEDCVDASIQRLEDYTQKHDGELITAIKNDTDNIMDSRMTIIRKQKWEEKKLYGRFKRLINNISHEKKLDMAKTRKLSEKQNLS